MYNWIYDLENVIIVDEWKNEENEKYNKARIMLGYFEDIDNIVYLEEPNEDLGEIVSLKIGNDIVYLYEEEKWNFISDLSYELEIKQREAVKIYMKMLEYTLKRIDKNELRYLINGRYLFDYEYEIRTDNENIAELLTMITGNNWSVGALRGCVQGDYQEIIYNTDKTEEWELEELEEELFYTYY